MVNGMTVLDRDNRYFELVKNFPLKPITSESQNDKAGKICSDLASRYDKLNRGEKDYLAVLSRLVEDFESQWDEQDAVEPRELLEFLMEQNELAQKDLVPIFGSSSRVSEYLNGKRDLSLSQIIKLAKRFALSPAAFIPKE